MSKRITLADEINRRRDNSIHIEMPDGQDDIVLDQPDLWPDDRVAAIDEARNSGDMAKLGQILLGADYERFVAAGGTSMIAWGIFKEHVGSLGESSDS